MTGQLVIVAGTTGSGKTTTCKEFVVSSNDLWLHFGMDLFFGTIVSSLYSTNGPRSSEGLHLVPDDPAQPDGPGHFELGREGPGLVRAMHEMVAAAVRSGQRVIMDAMMMTDPPFLQDSLARLHDLPVLFVVLRPAEHLLDQRLEQRIAEYLNHPSNSGDPGLARRLTEKLKRARNSMTSGVFSHDSYDLVIDSGALKPRQVVERIQARLQEGPGEGFARLAKRFDLTIDPFTQAKFGGGTGRSPVNRQR